jgi:hypothetical protein
MKGPTLSRNDWPLVAAGVTAGLVVAMLVIYLFVTGITDRTPVLVDGETGVIERPSRPGFPEGPGQGLIGQRERAIWNRLEPQRVAARPLRGPISISARDMVWNDPAGARFATAARVTARLDARAAARGDVLLDDVVLREAVVDLRQRRPGGAWNFEAVFAELLGAEPAPGPPRTIRLTNVQLVDGTVRVDRPEQRFVLHDVTGRMPLAVLSQPGVPDPWLRLSTLNMRFEQSFPEQGQLAIRAEDGVLYFPDGRVRFDIASLNLDRTRLARLEGVWNPEDPGFGITGRGLALEVRLEDVAFLMPEGFPPAGTASFAFALRPLPLDRTEAVLTDLDARFQGSRIAGATAVQFGEEFFLLRSAELVLDPLQLAVVEGFAGPLPLGGALRGRVTGADGDIRFDLAADLTAPQVAPFTVGISGRALLREDALLLQQADLQFQRAPLAALRAVAPGLPLEGFVTGRVTLTGPPAAAPLALDVRLELGAGVALVEGTVDLRGEVPAYDLRGRLLAVDLPAILAPDVPPVALTATFAMAGSGFDPALMNAFVRLDGRFTGWETGSADTVHLRADIRNGTLDLQALQMQLATAAVQASGSWRFLAPQAGAIRYAVDISSLRPFGPYLPVVGDEVAAGAIVAAGTVSGTLDRMRLAGELQASAVRAGAWQARTLEAAYDMTVGGETLPRLVVQGRGAGVVTPTAGEFATIVVELEMVAPGFAAQLQGVRPDGGRVEVVATGDIPETGARLIVVERAHFDLAEGQWALARPATVRWVGDDWFIDGLVLEDQAGPGRLALDGRILPMVGVDIRFALEALPTGELQRLAGITPPRVEGTLWAEGMVVGSVDDPQLEVQFRLEDGAIENVPLEAFRGTIVHAGAQTRVVAQLVADTLGYVELDVQLPSVVRIGGAPIFELVDGLPLSGRLTANRFAMSALAAVFPANFRDVTGFVDAEVVLSGTAEAPVVAGDARLAGGALTVVELNQRWTEITGDVGFDGRRLLIRDLRARSGGWLVVGGQVVLERLDQPVAELSIAFDGFRPMGVDGQRDAALFGRLAVTGPPLALELSGNLLVDDGFVLIPEFGGPGQQLVDVTTPAPVAGRPLEPLPAGGVYQGLAIRNLVVTAGDGAWFIADQARVQLSGQLVVNKTGMATPITGTLSGTRGQYTLIAGPLVRRFDVISAQLRFFGEPQPNPQVDFTVRRMVFDPGGRQLDVNVRISGTLTNPRISLAGGEAAGIAEAELLSFLIFGQPTFALGGELLPGDQLEQVFVGGFAELLAIELERGLGGLGLDVFQIRLGRGPLGGLGAPTLVLGRQLRDDVFITVETGITALFGGGGAGELPNHWAVRLDWAFAPASRATLAWEPVYAGRAFRGAVFALPLTQQRQQFLLEVRRRWGY